MAVETRIGVMDLLKEQTAEHHARAEKRQLQQDLVRGTVSRERYGAWLGQMLLVHLALEKAVDAFRASVPALRHVTAQQTHSVRLAEDLATFGIDAKGVRALPATAALISEIAAGAAREPASVVGFHYVLEGSMNGNRYIAMAVRKGLGLQPGQGDRYLDPYGEAQRATWGAFRGAMSQEAFSDAQTSAIIDAAKAMFDGIAGLSDQVV